MGLMRQHSKASHLASRENIKIFSIYLLILLIDSRLSDFHTELENLPQYLLSNKFIRFVLNIEHSLITGQYLKILKSKPPKAFKKVLERLTISLRRNIATCIEKSHKHITSNAVIRLLEIKNQMDFSILKIKRNWEILDNVIYFNEEGNNQDIVSSDKIEMQLHYIREIERII